MAEPTSEEIAAFAAAAGVDQTQDAEPELEPQDTSQEAPEFVLGTYRTLEEAERGLAEKDRLIAERAEEVGQLRREVEESKRQDYFQQGQSAPQVEQSKYITDQQVYEMQAYIEQIQRDEGDDFKAIRLENQLRDAILERRFGEFQDAQEARDARLERPLVQMQNEKIAQTAIEGAKTLLGADADQILYEYRDVVIDAANTNPQILGQEGGIRAEQIARLVLGEKALRERQGTPPRNDQGQFVPVSGGSGAEPSQDTLPQADTLEPGDPRLAFAQTVKKDAFGTIPSFAGQ